MVLNGGIGVPGLPPMIVATKPSAGLSASASAVSAGPSPPFRVRP